jgi:2-keto-4-pentenoate hydratase/2-oxohepta-3-ene-1,7-dioic acid hydratase in catechol pathway
VRFLAFEQSGAAGLAIAGAGGGYHGLRAGDANYPGDLDAILRGGSDALAAAAKALADGPAIDISAVTVRPPLSAPGKILCIGLNYADHAAEGGFTPPDHPTVFARFNTSLIGHGAPLIRPRASTQYDYEGELVAVIGKPGRHIPHDQALDHVAGYSIFNDASVRDYQLRTPQWTVGKNFDASGAFGPIFVTADELPAGAKGVQLTTRLNGEVVQDASTDDLIFDVAALVTQLSEAMTLETGDIIVTGTPAGVGFARKPPLFMKDGDVCEVEIEGIGVLSNPVIDEAA